MSMYKKTACITILLLLLAGAATASPWDDFRNRFFPAQPVQPQGIPEARWTALSNDLLTLNTPSNIQALSAYTQPYNVRSVRVDVIDLRHSFYVVPGYGIYFGSGGGVDDMQVRLTEEQVRQIMYMVKDGYVSPFERFRIWLLLRR